MIVIPSRIEMEGTFVEVTPSETNDVIGTRVRIESGTSGSIYEVIIEAIIDPPK